MGKVTEELRSLITRQVQERGIVVWYDPDQAYVEAVDGLEVPSATLLRFQGSFFELRHQMESFLEFVDDKGRLSPNLAARPRVLVYVPLDRGKTHHALVEAEAAGTFLEPGASTWQRNTRLKVLAERVFRQIAPQRAAAIGAEVEAGRRTLAELDWLADQTGELGSIKLVFGTSDAADIVLEFLKSEEHDQAMLHKQALPELAGLIGTELGLNLGAKQPIGQFRHVLCRALLLAEVAIQVGTSGGGGSTLAGIAVPEVPRQREAILALCREWRNRLNLQDCYAGWAAKVQTEANVLAWQIEAEALRAVETFGCFEALLLEAAEGQLLRGEIDKCLELARARKGSFWSLQVGELQLRWTLVEMAAQLLLAARWIESELKRVGGDAAAMVEAYVQGLTGAGDQLALPWSLLDRYARHLEHRYALLELRTDGQHDQLELVIRHVRHRYAEVAGRCAEAFAGAWAAASFQAGNLLSQRTVFHKMVQGRLSEGKTAYILADALRWEMAQELVAGLGEDFAVELLPALAQLPTITEVGMAALLPGAEQGMELIDAGGGRVAVRLGETVLKDRAARMKHFAAQVVGRSLVLKLDELMKPTKKRQEEIAAADVLLVTSQEIDRRGEETEEEEARRYVDDVLDKLRRGMRRLASLGVRRIVLAADHGHFFVEELDAALRMDPPGGQTTDLHARAWVGRGGQSAPGYLRVKAGQIGLDGDLEVAFPLGLATFRTRGSNRGYFHGGISLEEVIVPVASIAVRAGRLPGPETATVTLTLARPKITTRFFSVEARYVASGLFAEEKRPVKVLVRGVKGEIGLAAMAAYGFEEGTQEIVLERDRPNAITLMITEEEKTPMVSIHVLDAVSQVELAAVKNIPLDIAI